MVFLDQEDIEELLGFENNAGGGKLGHRITLQRELSRMQQVSRISSKNKTLLRFIRHYWFPCFVLFKDRYNLTQASLQMKRSTLTGEHQMQVDLSSIKDLDFTVTCLRSYLTIYSSDITSPELLIPLSRSGGEVVYQTLRRAWEHDQSHMAGNKGKHGNRI